MVQCSHLYMTTGRTIALTVRTFAGKVMSLLFNKLSRIVIAFLPRSKCILISWLESPSIVISEPKKLKSVTVSIFTPSICHEVYYRGYLIFHSLLVKTEETLRDYLKFSFRFKTKCILTLKTTWTLWYNSLRNSFRLCSVTTWCHENPWRSEVSIYSLHWSIAVSWIIGI